MQPYYQEKGIQIFHGDCLEVLPQLPNVDLVLTDPPYNFSFNYGKHDDDMPRAEYVDWCRSWFGMCQASATRQFVFPGHGNLDVWWGIKKPGSVGCWYKPGNPAGGGLFQFCEFEPFLYWGKFVGGSNVFRATVTEQSDTGNHPCPKPRDLMRQIVKRLKPESIIDPFMGSGTTLLAAKNFDISAIGIELEERWCETAAKRLSQEVLQFA